MVLRIFFVVFGRRIAAVDGMGVVFYDFQSPVATLVSAMNYGIGRFIVPVKDFGFSF